MPEQHGRHKCIQFHHSIYLGHSWTRNQHPVHLFQFSFLPAGIFAWFFRLHTPLLILMFHHVIPHWDYLFGNYVQNPKELGLGNWSAPQCSFCWRTLWFANLPSLVVMALFQLPNWSSFRSFMIALAISHWFFSIFSTMGESQSTNFDHDSSEKMLSPITEPSPREYPAYSEPLSKQENNSNVEMLGLLPIPWFFDLQ